MKLLPILRFGCSVAGHTFHPSGICVFVRKMSACRTMCNGLINKFRAILLTTHIQLVVGVCRMKCFPFFPLLFAFGKNSISQKERARVAMGGGRESRKKNKQQQQYVSDEAIKSFYFSFSNHRLKRLPYNTLAFLHIFLPLHHRHRHHHCRRRCHRLTHAKERTRENGKFMAFNTRHSSMFLSWK